MQCFSAIELANGRKVPCGQCINCRINKGRKWTGRLLLEHLTTENQRPGSQDYFVTLTYNDENLPKTDEGHPTLAKRAFLKWINNYQQREAAFRYFAVGEYGDDTKRPHYHMAVFQQFPQEIESLLKSWGSRGFTTYALLEKTRAAYLCQYTVKKLTKAGDDRLHKDAEPEFRSSSRRPPLAHACIPLEVARYRSACGRAVIAETGDIGRSFRFEGKIYPFDSYLLRKIRQGVGVPLTHAERIDANPRYMAYHDMHEAQQCEETAKTLEARYHAQKIRKRPSTNRV